MKKLCLLFSVLILLISFSCDNEPLEGDFLTDEPTATCEQALMNTATATLNFVSATEATYSELCIALRNALEAQIDACGDADGSLQATIDSLDCDSTDPEELILIKEIITTYEDDSVFTETFSYDGNKLMSIVDSDGYETTYEYENNLLTRINWYETDGSLGDYVIPEYNSENKLISYTVYITSGNEGLRFDLTYNNDGTITEMKYSGDHTSQTSLISEGLITMENDQIIIEDYNDGYMGSYTYDNKNGMFKNISNIETLNLINIDFSGYIPSGQNNLLTITENDNGDVVVYEEYEYTYNSNNYPETSIVYLEGELDATTQYIYE